MATSCTPVSDWMLWPYQPYFRTACFLVGCLEREHWLNVEDLYAYWLRGSAGWLRQIAGAVPLWVMQVHSPRRLGCAVLSEPQQTNECGQHR